MTVYIEIDQRNTNFVLDNGKRIKVTKKDWIKQGRIADVEKLITEKAEKPEIDRNNPNTAYFYVKNKLVAILDRESGKAVTIYTSPSLKPYLTESLMKTRASTLLESIKTEEL